MDNNIKIQIKRGKEAFESFINEEDLNLVAQKYNISLNILVKDMKTYINRILDPKPSEQKLATYDEIKRKKRQNALKEIKTFYQNNNEEIDPKILIEKAAFDAFITTDKNPSAIVDLALKQGLEPEAVRNNAFKHSKRVDQYKPTEEEIAIFNAVNISRKESYQKERIDFTYLDKLLNLESTLVNDYLEIVINEELSPSMVLNKIDLYIKYFKEETENIKKLTLIKAHLKSNYNYIVNERRNRSKNKLSNQEEEHFREITGKILEEYLIDNSVTIKSLLLKYDLTENVFNNNLKIFSTGFPKEQILYKEYINLLEEEKNNIAEYIKTIYHYLNNGIEKNDQIDNFNILDYYRIIGLKPEILLDKAWKNISDELYTRSQLTRVSHFFATVSKNNYVYTEEELLNQHVSYNDQIITNIDIKIKIIKYLKKLNIPLSSSAYFAATEEYLKGQLNLNPLSLE